MLVVEGPDGATQRIIPDRGAGMDFSYEISGRSGARLGSFRVDEPGAYRIRLESGVGGEPGNFPAYLLHFGRLDFGAPVVAMIGGFVVAGIFTLAAIVLFIVTIVRRNPSSAATVRCRSDIRWGRGATCRPVHGHHRRLAVGGRHPPTARCRMATTATARGATAASAGAVGPHQPAGRLDPTERELGTAAVTGVAQRATGLGAACRASAPVRPRGTAGPVASRSRRRRHRRGRRARCRDERGPADPAASSDAAPSEGSDSDGSSDSDPGGRAS